MTWQAVFNSTVIAESNETVEVEGNHYFPLTSVKTEYLTEASGSTVCPWKGAATYFHLTVDGTSANNAAWTYRKPTQLAENIRDHVAFYPSVKVHEA